MAARRSVARWPAARGPATPGPIGAAVVRGFADNPTFLRPVPRPAPGPDWPARAMLALLFLSAVAMLSLPQARAASATFGWLPLWLPGLPATAWLALAVARRRTTSA